MSLSHASLVSALRQLCGIDAVADDTRSRELVAHDIFSHAANLAVAVVAPGTVATLARALAQAVAQAVAHITAQGLAVVPRGGGMSHTQGYVPQDAARVLTADQ